MSGLFSITLWLALLPNAVALPPRGEGYFTPSAWRDRGLRWGTPALVSLIERAARRVNDELGGTLYVGDLSTERGGRTPWHKSHRRGCDVDLIYYATDEDGDPGPIPSQMARFDREGKARGTDELGQPIALAFDTERNWALVRALLEDPLAHVTRIFVANRLKRLLLAFAREHDEDEALIAQAEGVLGQPGDSTPHDDHMHVRIAHAPGASDDDEPRSPSRAHKQARKHHTRRR
jgi:penicillin-insensitive murein endopeptidase